MVNPLIVIPTLEPDQKLIKLLADIREVDQGLSILMIDDGSGDKYQNIFDQAEENFNVQVIHHPKNRGKGAALKTAMAAILVDYPEIDVMVTIDSDGQHSYSDMMKTVELAKHHPDGLVLGTRQFDRNVPLRSKFGNLVTRMIMRVTTGIQVSDTQTGLRVIPREFLPQLVEVSGDRFEYETNMLIETRKQGWPIYAQPIQTIYIEDNASSHFRIIKDSIAIYGVVFKYILSSISSFLLDVLLYAVFIHLLNQLNLSAIFIASILSRLISSLFNYYINQKFVFQKSSSYALLKYYSLVILQISLSSLLVFAIHQIFKLDEVVGVKILVDTFLFLLSYFVQKTFIFKEK